MGETTTIRETERKYSGEPIDVNLVVALATAAAEATQGSAGPPREPAEFALSAVYFDTDPSAEAGTGDTLSVVPCSRITFADKGDDVIRCQPILGECRGIARVNRTRGRRILVHVVAGARRTRSSAGCASFARRRSRA